MTHQTFGTVLMVVSTANALWATRFAIKGEWSKAAYFMAMAAWVWP